MTIIKRAPITIIILIAIAVIGVIGVYIASQFSSSKNRRAFDGIAVEVEQVRVGSLTKKVKTTGVLVANQFVKIKPETHGLVSKIFVKGGEAVNAGDPLFEIDSRTAQSDLKDAEAKLVLMKSEFSRADKLASGQFGPIKNRDKALAEMKMAEAAVENAKTRLERTVMYAPFEGIVGIHNIALGSFINEQMELLTLVDIDPIKVDFKLPGMDLRYISVGQKVTVTVDGFNEKSMIASIDSIDSTVEEAGHSIAVRAELPNKKGRFKPGLFARVDVVVGSKDNALIVPTTAVETTGDEEYVYKAVDGYAVKTPVSTGIQEEENVEILRGLNPDDLVVTVGQMKIRDGMPIKFTHESQNVVPAKQPAQKEEVAAVKPVEPSKDAAKAVESHKKDVITETSASDTAPQAVKKDANVDKDSVAETDESATEDSKEKESSTKTVEEPTVESDNQNTNSTVDEKKDEVAPSNQQ